MTVRDPHLLEPSDFTLVYNPGTLPWEVHLRGYKYSDHSFKFFAHRRVKRYRKKVRQARAISAPDRVDATT